MVLNGRFQVWNGIVWKILPAMEDGRFTFHSVICPVCKYIKRKIKYNEGVTGTGNCLVTYHSTVLTVVIISPIQFISGGKQDAGYGLLFFETEK